MLKKLIILSSLIGIMMSLTMRVAEAEFRIISPNGGEEWAGGSPRDIKLVVTGGSPPYTLEASYSTDAGITYPYFIGTTTQTEDGTYTYNWTLPNINSKNVKIQVLGTDSATPTPETYSDVSDGTFTIDSSLPIILLTPYTPDPTKDNTPTYTGTATDTMTKMVDIEYKVDDGNWVDVDPFSQASTVTFTFTTGTLSDGPHTITVRAKDEAGNWGTSTSDTLLVDTTPPIVILNPYTPDPTNDNTPTYTGTATDATDIMVIEYKVDDGGWDFVGTNYGTRTVPFTFTIGPLSNGPHTISFRAQDYSGGNMGSATSDTLFVDISIPNVLLSSYTPDPTNDNTPTYTGTATDTMTKIVDIEYKVDNGNWVDVDPFSQASTVTFTFTTGTLSDGPHTITVRAQDEAGNWGTSTPDTLVVDTSPPIVILNPYTPDPTNDNTPPYTGTATDTMTKIVDIEYKVDSGDWTDVDPFITTSTVVFKFTPILSDGPHTITVRAKNELNNWGTSTSDILVVDVTSPTVILNPYAPDPTNDNTPTYRGSATDTTTKIVDIKYKVDDGNWVDVDPFSQASMVTFTFTIGPLSDRPHTITVRAQDEAENWSSFVSDILVVDTTPSNIILNPYTPNPTNDNTPTYTGTATDTMTKIKVIEYQVDGGTWKPVNLFSEALSVPFTFTTGPLSDGHHTITVRAKDEAGNWGTSTPDTLVVDTTPPNVVLAPYTPDPTNDNTPTYTGSATDATTKIMEIQYRIDSGDWVIGTIIPGLTVYFTFTTNALIDGPHTITVKARDEAGNGGTSTPDTLVVDTTPSNVVLAPYTPDPTNDNTPTYTGNVTDKTKIVDIEYKVDDGDWTNATFTPGLIVSFTFTTTALLDGPHTITVRAKDESGNWGTSTPDILVIDTTPPNVVLAPYTPDPTNDNTPTYTGSATDTLTKIVEIWYSVDNGDPSIVSITPGLTIYFTFTTYPLLDAPHTITVKAKDEAGNWRTSTPDILVVDTTPPNVVLAPYTPDPSNDNTPTYTGNATDKTKIVDIEYKIDDGDWTNATFTPGLIVSFTFTTTALLDGPHTITVRTKDEAGNWGTSTPDTLVVDTNPPIVVLNPYTPDPTNDNTPTYTGIATEATTKIKEIWYRVGTETWTGIAITEGVSVLFTFTTTALFDGTHTITVRAKDEAGNWGTSTPDTLVVDTNPPIVVLNPYTPDPTNDNTPTYTGIATEATTKIKEIWYRVGTETWTGIAITEGVSVSFTFTTTALLDGPHTITVRAKDEAENWGTSSPDTLNIDTKPPYIRQAIYKDKGSIGLNAGDEIEITFNELIKSESLSINDFKLNVQGDTFGTGAMTTKNEISTGTYTVTIILGNEPKLKVPGKYVGVTTPGSPSGINVKETSSINDIAGNMATTTTEQISDQDIIDKDSPKISRAIYVDKPNTAPGVSSGDELLIIFTEDITINGAVPEDFYLPVHGDTFGMEATITQTAKSEIKIILGTQTFLTIEGIYQKGFIGTGNPSGIDISKNIMPGHIIDLSGNDAVSLEEGNEKDIEFEDKVLPTIENLLPKNGEVVNNLPVISAWLRDVGAAYNSGINPDSITIFLNGNRVIDIKKLEFDEQKSQDKFEGNNLTVILKTPLSQGEYTLSMIVADKRDNWSATATTKFIVGQPEIVSQLINYPNPFTSGEGTYIRYVLGEPGRVTINIYDISWQLVTSIEIGDRDAGIQKEKWVGLSALNEKLPNGIYFCEIVVIERDSGAEHKKYSKMAVFNER
ncbi:MAG: Ig-like domain-containing protein [bacterium]